MNGTSPSQGGRALTLQISRFRADTGAAINGTVRFIRILNLDKSQRNSVIER